MDATPLHKRETFCKREEKEGECVGGMEDGNSTCAVCCYVIALANAFFRDDDISSSSFSRASLDRLIMPRLVVKVKCLKSRRRRKNVSLCTLFELSL